MNFEEGEHTVMKKFKTVRTKGETIETRWEVRSYDVWGNARDGYEVNNVFRGGVREMSLQVVTYNAGTSLEFKGAEPSDKQLREALGCGGRGRPIQITTDGDDVQIYVNRERDGYPIGELFCISHESLSPIRPIGTKNGALSDENRETLFFSEEAFFGKDAIREE